MRKRPVGTAASTLLVPVLAAVLVLAGCGTSTSPAAQVSSASDTSTPAGITTEGTGQVSGAPDVMTLTLDVQTTGAHATDALAANAGKLSAVIGALASHGVAARR